MADTTPDAAKPPLGHAFVRGKGLLVEETQCCFCPNPRSELVVCGQPESAHLPAEAPSSPSAEAVESAEQFAIRFVEEVMPDPDAHGDEAEQPTGVPGHSRMLCKCNVDDDCSNTLALTLASEVEARDKAIGDARAREQDRATRLECAKKVCLGCKRDDHRGYCRAVELGILPAEEGRDGE